MGKKIKTDEDDQIIRLVGNFGKWQALLICPLFLHFVFGSYQTLVTSFLSLKGDFWCEIEAPEGVFESYEQWRNFSNPIKENGEVDKCNIYDLDYSLLSKLAMQRGESAEAFMSEVKTKNCTKFKFDDTDFETSIITDFSLVCGQGWLVTLAQVVYMFGFLVGASGSGMISDRFGRKITIIIFSISMSVFSIVLSFAKTVEVFIFLRWCTAVSSIGFWTTFYVYAMEMVGSNWKTWLGIGFEFPWALAYTTLPGIAYYVRNWRHLQLVISCPPVIFLPIYFFLTESPRWLLSQGRVDEAKVILEKAVKMNGRQWPEGFVLASTSDKPSKDAEDDEKRGATYLDLFRTPNLRKNTLIQYFNWFTASFVYYGLTFDSGSIVPGNIYINFLVSGLIEFPAYALCLIILYKLGRRGPLAFMYFLGGISLFIMLGTPDGNPTLGMASLGKFGIICAFAIIYVHAAELYPTVLRNTGLGSSSSFARIGSMIAPVIGNELVKVEGYGRSLVIVIFAATSTIAGFLTIFLPETNHRKLPESIEEGENFGKGETALDVCFKRKNKNAEADDDDNDKSEEIGMDNKAYAQNE